MNLELSKAMHLAACDSFVLDVEMIGSGCVLDGEAIMSEPERQPSVTLCRLDLVIKGGLAPLLEGLCEILPSCL